MSFSLDALKGLYKGLYHIWVIKEDTRGLDMIRLQLISFQFASHLSKHDTSLHNPPYNPLKKFRL